jgi:hypothetical protein
MKQWLAEQAAENSSSQNSEIVRALRAQMKRHGHERRLLLRRLVPSEPED